MPRIKQQRNRRMLHKQIKLRLGFDHSGHVMMIGNRHPLGRAPIGKVRHLAPIGGHLGLADHWLLRQRHLALALHRPRCFPVDDARRACGFEKRHLLCNAIFFALDIPIKQFTRKPSATNRDPIAIQDRAQNRHIHWKAAACFHAAKPCLRGLGQTFL